LRRAKGNLLDGEEFFRLAYGREPTEHDLGLLGTVVPTGIRDASDARRVLTRFDAQTHPTRFTVRLGEADLAEVGLDGCSLVVDRADPAVSLDVLEQGVWEPHVARQLRRFLSPGMTFVDVGANIGYHTFLGASLVGCDGRVIAFEPSSENCRLLMASRLRNDAMQVDIRPVALDASPGVALLGHHVGSNAELMAQDTTSLARGSGDVVVARRLDDEVDGPVHVMKIDVEGAELRVLRGAQDTLARERPVVIMEFSYEMLRRVSGVEPSEALSFMADRAYRIALLDKQTLDPVPFSSPAQLLAAWGTWEQAWDRIEDLLFVPVEIPAPA
jgi:FkbM family methyltransferase